MSRTAKLPNEGGPPDPQERPPTCAICGNRKHFELPADLLTSFLEGKVSIFAGAGISSENQNVIGYTLYDELKSVLEATNAKFDFPALVSEFCKRPNGRLNFIERLHARLRHIRATPEFYWFATRFHRALAPISKLDTIVTTNWDDFFERECWATPFVYSEDMAFWTAAERKILKIHGTIENLGSIVASTEDYNACARRLSEDLIGSRLKLILADKTIVFCGYSLKDFDFQELLKFVTAEMRGFNRQAYIVTLDESDEAKERFAKFGIKPIFVDGACFLEELYRRWQEKECVSPLALYSEAANLLDCVREEHIRLSDNIKMQDHPSVIFSLFYQDGMIHALDRIKLHRRSGNYTDIHRLIARARTYEAIRKKAVKLRKYDDAAYVEGYLAALIHALAFSEDEETEYPPMYFDFKEKYFFDIEEYESHLADPTEEHKASRRFATNIVSKYRGSDGFVLDHLFRLTGLLPTEQV